jgi:serine protease Do
MRLSHCLWVVCTAVAAATLVTTVCIAQPQSMSPEKLYRYLSPSVWVVRTYDADGLSIATGSAVVTGPETLLTNCHVLKTAKRVVVRNDNLQHDARLQYIDVARDMCQITARNLRAPSVMLADSDQLSVGQKVFALGSPRGLELTLSDGLISALRRDEDNRSLMRIQTSAPISHGSSGGGLFDSAGQLIGITTSGFDDAQNLNFAIPINWLRDLAARSDAALRTARPSAPAATAAVIPPSQPNGSGTAPIVSVMDADAVPVNAHCKEEYRKYIAARHPKAFAIAAAGHCAWAFGTKANRPHISTSPDPVVRAMELCVYMHKDGCALYAVNADLVAALGMKK